MSEEAATTLSARLEAIRTDAPVARAAAPNLDRLAIDTIRTLAMDAVQKAESGHPGAPMALAPVGYTLWQSFLRYDPKTPSWPNRDRFVLSNGHASMLLYALLHLAGVRESGDPRRPAVTLDDIKAFRQLDSRCPGHPEHGLTTGVETTTGPLGQGCGNSVGMAMASKWLAARFNRPANNGEWATLFDYDVYTLCGDGDMMEGVTSEAASIAGHLRLGNLCWIYDNNSITIEGRTALAFSDDVAARFRAYGWRTEHVADANDTAALARALDAFKGDRSAPMLVVVDSHIGYGSPHKQDSEKAHGEALGEAEVRLTKAFYGWPEDAQFLVPDGVRAHFDAGMGARGAKLSAQWADTMGAYRKAWPDQAAELDALLAGGLPADWDKALPGFLADAKGEATRASGAKVLNAVAPAYPWLLGGAADLSPSTKTDLTFAGAGSFEAGSPGGRNLHFGIREHAMGAIVNGMTLSGLRAYGSTFLIFSDYMKPPIRLAALMQQPAIFVFTHDSIGLGEDGPTHQPVEQMLSLRSVPGLVTLRPADANEVVEAWKVIAQLRASPAALVLTRQAVPTFDRTIYASAAGVAKGAYVMADAKAGVPELILIGTGSEVSLCVGAYETLKGEGVAVRVVSMPSWELFERQDEAYRESVLPRAVRARVSVEAGSVIGWDRYVGASGQVIGMHTLGSSAPIKDLMHKFGFSPEAVLAAARRQLSQAKGNPLANTLQALGQAGQSPWLDYLKRSLVDSGDLARMIVRDGLKGLTSNPSIFEKAIGESDEYAGAIKAFTAAGSGGTAPSLTRTYEHLVIADIRAAADALRGIYDDTCGRDGFVSLECSPYLADDTAATIAEGEHLWASVARPNLMVKVPATDAGLPAIRALIGKGINVNITLLFSVEVYRQVAEAYMAGLEDLRAAGGDVAKVASVASFFISRIDVAVDKAIDALDDPARGQPLRGRIAVASAKLAYAAYGDLFAGPRWDSLVASGARTQRLLWASTSTKSKALKDTIYIEALIGRDTVNTIPPAIMDAFRDHGVVQADAIETGLDDARQRLRELAGLGIDVEAVCRDLVAEGVDQFAAAFDQLFAAIARQTRDASQPAATALQS